MTKLLISKVFEDLFPHGIHIFLPISFRTTSKEMIVSVNQKWIAKAVFLKKVPENQCCISNSFSNYLNVEDLIDVELVEEELLPLQRITLEILSPIDVDLESYTLLNYLLAGEVVAVEYHFEFEYLGVVVNARVKEANCPIGKIAVNTDLKVCYRPFHEAYSPPDILPATLGIEEFTSVGKSLLEDLEIFIELDREAPLIMGCLFYGARGSGKTNLACNILKNTGLHMKYLKCSDLSDSNLNLTCENYAHAFQHRGILILDELELVKELQIQKFIYELFQNPRADSLFVVGITSDIYSLDQILKLPASFFTKLHLTLPKNESRLKLLRHFLSSDVIMEECKSDPFLSNLATKIKGYSPADIVGLIRQAILLQKSDHLTEVTLLIASDLISPSNLTGHTTKIQKVDFKDLCGMDIIIRQIRNEIVNPINDMERYLKIGISPPKGVLIYGPSGVGKTAAALAIVNEIGISCVSVDGPSIRSQIVGQSEQAIHTLFKTARSAAPCVLLIDQIDMIVAKRGSKNTSHSSGDRIITSFLTEMDGILSKDSSNHVFIIAITSRIEDIDPAIIRPGRLDVHIRISLPDLAARRSIMSSTLKKMPTDLKECHIFDIADSLENCSSSDIVNICREAAMNAIRNGRSAVVRSDFSS